MFVWAYIGWTTKKREFLRSSRMKWKVRWLFFHTNPCIWIGIESLNIVFLRSNSNKIEMGKHSAQADSIDSAKRLRRHFNDWCRQRFQFLWENLISPKWSFATFESMGRSYDRESIINEMIEYRQKMETKRYCE